MFLMPTYKDKLGARRFWNEVNTHCDLMPKVGTFMLTLQGPISAQTMYPLVLKAQLKWSGVWIHWICWLREKPMRMVIFRGRFLKRRWLSGWTIILVGMPCQLTWVRVREDTRPSTQPDMITCQRVATKNHSIMHSRLVPIKGRGWYNLSNPSLQLNMSTILQDQINGHTVLFMFCFSQPEALISKA